MIELKESSHGVIFMVKVVPGSQRTIVSGTLDGMLKVKISAPPEKGKANKCLIDCLSNVFHVKKKDVNILSGQTCPIKEIQVSGIAVEDVSRTIAEVIG